MVRREFSTTLLAYNLIRTTAANAAWLHDKQPRQISFTATTQYVLSAGALLTGHTMTAGQLHECCLALCARWQAAKLPTALAGSNRVCSRRRRHGYPLMQKPRHVLRQELHKHCT